MFHSLAKSEDVFAYGAEEFNLRMVIGAVVAVGIIDVHNIEVAGGVPGTGVVLDWVVA